MQCRWHCPEFYVTQWADLRWGPLIIDVDLLDHKINGRFYHVKGFVDLTYFLDEKWTPADPTGFFQLNKQFMVGKTCSAVIISLIFKEDSRSEMADSNFISGFDVQTALISGPINEPRSSQKSSEFWVGLSPVTRFYVNMLGGFWSIVMPSYRHS